MDLKALVLIYLTCITLFFMGPRKSVDMLKNVYVWVLNFHSSSIFYSNLVSFLCGYYFCQFLKGKSTVDLNSEHDTNLSESQVRGTTQIVDKPLKESADKLDKDCEENIKIIQSVPLMANLNRSEVIRLAENLKHDEFDEGEALMVQGEKGDKFFIVKEGICEVEINDKGASKVVATLGRGDYCGEQALISWDAKRNATVRAKFSTKCLTLDRANFLKIFQDSKVRFAKRDAKRGAIQAENVEDVLIDRSKITPKSPEKTLWLLKCVRSNVLFENYTDSQKEVLVDHMTLLFVKKSEVLINQGESGNEFYVVEEGLFNVSVNGTQVSTVERGMCVGELALIYDAPRAATVKAIESSKVWSLNRVTFRAILMQHNRNESQKNIGFLRKVSLLTPLLNSELILLDQALQTRQFKKGHIVFEQGDEAANFYIVKSGTVSGVKKVDDRKEEFYLSVGDFFGERALLKNEPRAATITCDTNVTLMVLSRRDFRVILGPLEDIMSRHAQKYDEVSAPVNKKWDSGVKYPDLKQFKNNTKGVLGAGAFGKVSLVVDPEKEASYALKAVSKLQVVQNKQTTQIMNEKMVMQRFDSMFLVNLLSTFQDDWFLYFLLDVCLGGELFTIHRKHGSFDEATARFYVGCVVEGFVHMHSHKVAYRDLKPENLVLDSDGYLRITDFGLSKFIDGNTFTMCGTPDYLAPEIITGQGHGLAVDWWALGVLIFELVASSAPFFDEDMNGTFRLIMACDFQFPKVFSPECKDIIGRLLQIRPTKRLGVIKGGSELIKKQPWFNGFKWEKLTKKALEAPMKPNVTSFDDINNFSSEDSGDTNYKFELSDIDMSWANDF